MIYLWTDQIDHDLSGVCIVFSFQPKNNSISTSEREIPIYGRCPKHP